MNAESDVTTGAALLEESRRQTHALELIARLVSIWFGLTVLALIVWAIAAIS